jgi:replicative DNA helicase
MSEKFIPVSIADVVDNSLKEIEDRKNGLTSKGLKTKWSGINTLLGGGFQKGFNYLIAGLSGSGKSTLANIIETDIFDYNPDEDIIVLNFNFETPSIMNLVKKYSADVGMTVNELMSSEETLSDQVLQTIKVKSQRYKKYPIYYFDVSGTVSNIAQTVIACHEKNPDKHIFCIVDHTTLVTPRNAQSELELVTELANTSIKLKKQTNCTFLMLGQLNSNIEQTDRLMNPALHSPMRSDLFGGKSVWNAMDCIFMPHRPDQLQLSEYTLNALPTKDMMYFHVRKQRYGQTGTVQMDCKDIGINKIEEIKLL